MADEADKEKLSGEGWASIREKKRGYVGTDFSVVFFAPNSLNIISFISSYFTDAPIAFSW